MHLETPRFTLRPFVVEDSGWIADLCGDPEVNRFLWDCAESMEESRRLADAMVNLDLNRHWFGNWAIQEKDTGILLRLDRIE